jgi:hypothetical protein
MFPLHSRHCGTKPRTQVDIADTPPAVAGLQQHFHKIPGSSYAKFWLRYRYVGSTTPKSRLQWGTAMRPALKLVCLWLILMSVALGGVRQAMAAGWSDADGKIQISAQGSCNPIGPDRHHAPNLCLLKYCCAASSSSDDEGGALKPTLVNWDQLLPESCDGQLGRRPEGRLARETPADRLSTSSTGPPARS